MPSTPSDPLILGFDVGTTAAKGAAFDLTGRRVAGWSTPYPMRRDAPGWATQDPEDWWDAVDGIVAALELSVDLDRVAAIGVCSQVNTHVFVDEAGRSLLPAITWQDVRCAELAGELDGALTDAERRELWDGGGAIDASSPIARAEWLRRAEPELFGRARWMLAPKDFVNLRLTGSVATDPISPISLVGADGRYLDGVRSRWPALAERLPPLRAFTDVLGTVEGRLGRVPGDAVVVTATMDAWGCRFGSRVVEEGDAMLVAGTSEVVGVLSCDGQAVPGIVTFIPVDGRVLHAGPTQAGGDALRWFCGAVGASRDEVLAEAAEAPAGAESLIFLPYLSGERAPIWDASARGAFVGLDARHDRGHLARATLEGVAYAVRHVLEAAEEAAGCAVDAVAVSGGGSRSDLWCQIKADVLGRPLHRLEVIDSGVLGAALMAGAGAGLMPPLDEAARRAVRTERVFEPDGRARAVYDELYGVYRELYPVLRPAFRALRG